MPCAWLAAVERFLAPTPEPRQHSEYMRVRGSLILISALVGSAHAEGDALVDMLGPREIAVGEAMRGAATGSSAIGLNPAGLPLNRELVFEGGYGYRPSDQASLFAVSACDSTNAAPGCFYYNYAGADAELTGGSMTMHRRTHLGGGAFGYPITPRVFLGSGIKYFNVKDDSMPALNNSGWAWDLGLTLRITDMISVGGAAQNLWAAESPEFPRAAGGGVVLRPKPTFSMSFDARWKLDGDDKSARYGGGAELFLPIGNGRIAFPLRAGGLRDNGLDATYVSAGFGVADMKWGLDVAGRFAVSGAEDTTIIARLRIYGPRLGARATDVAE